MVWKNVGSATIWTIVDNEQIFEQIDFKTYSKYVLQSCKLNGPVIKQICFEKDDYDTQQFIKLLLTDDLLQHDIEDMIEYGQNKMIYDSDIQPVHFVNPRDANYEGFRDELASTISNLQSEGLTLSLDMLQNHIIPYSVFLKCDHSFYLIDVTLIIDQQNVDQQIVSCTITKEGISFATFREVVIHYMADVAKENSRPPVIEDKADWLQKLIQASDSTDQSEETEDHESDDQETEENDDAKIAYSNSQIREICAKTVTLDDIINIPDDCSNDVIKRLCKLKKPIQNLQNMVGFDDIKAKLFEMVVLFCQQGTCKPLPHQRLHTLIFGSPGTGKTTFASILADLFCKLNFLKTSKVHHVKSSDLIGEYVGHTAPKIDKAVQKALGGVLLIDEAYTIGFSGEKGHNGGSFAQECLDALNRYLTERGDEFVCIMAGYKEEIEKNVLSMNRGLERRFNFRFEMPILDGKQLFFILKQKLSSEKYIFVCSEHEVEKFFQNNPMIYQGGDIETLTVQIELLAATKSFKTGDFLQNEKIEVSIDDLKEAYHKSFNHRTSEESEKSLLAMYL